MFVAFLWFSSGSYQPNKPFLPPPTRFYSVLLTKPHLVHTRNHTDYTSNRNLSIITADEAPVPEEARVSRGVLKRVVCLHHFFLSGICFPWDFVLELFLVSCLFVCLFVCFFPGILFV